MKRGFTHVRVGHAGAAANHHKKRTSSCTSGGLYTSPTTGASISTGSPVNVSWDTTCLNSSAIDIYLYAPSLATSLIHMWQNVNYGLGSYQTTLQPQWWNDSSSIDLQFSILESGTFLYQNTLPAGPIFTATSSGSSTGSSGAGTSAGITSVDNFPSNHSSDKGKIAAGVLVPLIFIGLGIAAYLKMSRSKGKEKRRRFSEAIDKRMSTISTDWKSMSAAGASAAIRNSIAVSSAGNRNSSFSFGAIRPVSTVAVDGAHSNNEKLSMDSSASPVSHLRPVRPSGLGDRVSRVSFAADVRPSMESRRTVTSRAYHTGFVPPVPPLHGAGELSPTQTKGAFSLTPEDIRTRISVSGDFASRPSMDEVFPALSMMRTGAETQNLGDDYLLPHKPSVEMPTPPSPIHAAPTSPVGMMPMPASVMSPDEMLRAYAERRIASPPPVGAPTFPLPVVNYNGNGMRTLYSPGAPAPASPAMARPPRKSISFADEDVGVVENADDTHLGLAT
ncbi:hypothetical protein SERLA73DRAFT_184470 [Serpula lacrymans var. lacrymans S7.3]|uniref:Uncharacterized protein n=2 Tax=Serpula lacrymans var. lacrymans TaxID=341189 RepID=F8Q3A9_SERL3|nr:uncharacterized protein SERLADRAFT_472171 [Serpula lacrymans var. lacrymans S7.9]EGN97670.1 hypothetical protein SERLA73DRAFT_184470 [Serpula lacrymans var. lacrymans S7.3]EGO23263.1 hypothetical protein SERLADRAFT_472171 [Serpula lacrymans var. lacrymans S7.9]